MFHKGICINFACMPFPQLKHSHSQSILLYILKEKESCLYRSWFELFTLCKPYVECWCWCITTITKYNHSPASVLFKWSSCWAFDVFWGILMSLKTTSTMNWGWVNYHMIHHGYITCLKSFHAVLSVYQNLNSYMFMKCIIFICPVCGCGFTLYFPYILRWYTFFCPVCGCLPRGGAQGLSPQRRRHC